MEGNRERVFTLGNKGREFARETLGKPVDWFFRPNKLKFFSYSAILHHLLLTRFISAASWLCRSRDNLTLLAQRVSYEFLKNPPRVTLSQKNKKTTLTVIPDAWLLFGTDKAKYAVLFELDRGMEYQEKFKQHVRGRIELIRSGIYKEVFGVPGVIVAYVTTGQTPAYRASRMKTMNVWTQQVLAELNLNSWGAIFRFSSVEFDTLFNDAPSLFEEPVWLRPDTKEPVRLFD
jgi:hypothetical protein